MYDIYPIYVIYAIFLACLGLVKTKQIQLWLCYFSFVFLFVFAEIGPDYNAYKYIYEMNAMGEQVHGESLYLLINKICASIGISYNLFRIVFLSLFVLLFMYSLSKISNNVVICFLFQYLAFLVYFISAYRQFAVISIFLYSIYLLFFKDYKTKKEFYKISILVLTINILAIFIHKSACLQVLLFLIYIVYKTVNDLKLIEICKSIASKLPQVMILSIIIRIVIFCVAKISFIQEFFSVIPYSKDISLFDLGYASRIFMFVLLYQMFIHKQFNEKIQILFIMYSVSMVLYFMLPFDLIMTRLINTIRFLEAILFVLMLNNYHGYESFKIRTYYINKRKCFIWLMVGVNVLVFISQLTLQNGYAYKHMLSFCF